MLPFLRYFLRPIARAVSSGCTCGPCDAVGRFDAAHTAFEQDQVPARVGGGHRNRDPGLARPGDRRGHHRFCALIGQALRVGNMPDVNPR